ncbi:MAG: hypothetical protein LUP97_03730 [Methanoregula sp.]|nr:hypothetical protein [Methanoregula sp.]
MCRAPGSLKPAAPHPAARGFVVLAKQRKPKTWSPSMSEIPASACILALSGIFRSVAASSGGSLSDEDALSFTGPEPGAPRHGN